MVSAIGRSLGLGLVLAGCTGDRPAEGAVPPVSPPVAAPSTATQAPPPAPDVAATPPEPEAAATPPDNQTRRELGADALVVVERADTTGAARLRMVGAEKAEHQAMTADTLIGGYPIEAPLVPLDAATRERLLKIVLDDASYEYGLARRCANDYFVGVRFQRGQQRVEFNLGVRCMQAFWSSGRAGDVKRSGGPMRDDIGVQVLELLDAAGVRRALK